MKVTVKRRKNAVKLHQSPRNITGVKKPVGCNGRNQTYHAVARTQTIPRRAKRGA